MKFLLLCLSLLAVNVYAERQLSDSEKNLIGASCGNGKYVENNGALACQPTEGYFSGRQLRRRGRQPPPAGPIAAGDAGTQVQTGTASGKTGKTPSTGKKDKVSNAKPVASPAAKVPAAPDAIPAATPPDSASEAAPAAKIPAPKPKKKNPVATSRRM